MRRRKSCRSHGEREITELLTEMNISFQREVKFYECVNAKGNMLRFDFYLPDHQLLIEYQGKHHYAPVNKGYRAKKVHNSTILHDSIKLNFVNRVGFRLLCIPYWERKNIRDIIMSNIG